MQVVQVVLLCSTAAAAAQIAWLTWKRKEIEPRWLGRWDRLMPHLTSLVQSRNGYVMVYSLVQGVALFLTRTHGTHTVFNSSKAILPEWPRIGPGQMMSPAASTRRSSSAMLPTARRRA